MDRIEESYFKLRHYIEKENFRGYDPYDTLLSWIPFHWFGKWVPLLAIQFQKRNPLNIRLLMGIKKEYNPKAMGLFLHAYSLMYQKTGEKQYLDRADFLFNWLKDNYSKGYSGIGWGYNFPWASSIKYLDAYVPSAVITGFVVKGIYQYYLISKNPKAPEVIRGATNFIRKDLPQYRDDSGMCISYTPVMKDICYNASLLAGETLAINYGLNREESDRKTCIEIVNFIVSRQKADGRWNYSEYPLTGKEREQIDFHQGYVLESIFNIKQLISEENTSWEKALKKGLSFYKEHQFFDNGRSLWRLPKKWPLDIHNQSQGIITFSRLKEYHPSYLAFAEQIAKWTIEHMQHLRKGYFYYQKFKTHTNKIPYMRWSQAWMLLALQSFIINKK